MATPAAAVVAGATVVGAGTMVYGAIRGEKAARRAKSAAQRQMEIDQEIARANNAFAEGQAAQTAAAHGAAAHAQRRAAHQIAAAAAQAREIAAANALLVEREGEETVSRAAKEHKSLEGSTSARMWASGTMANTGSQKKFKETLKKENKRERSWIKEAYQRQAQVVREGGELQSKQLTAEAIGIGAGAAQIEAAGALAYAQIIHEGRQGLAAVGLGPDGRVVEKSRPKIQAPRDYGRFNETAPRLSQGGGATGGGGGTTISGGPTLTGIGYGNK